MDLLPFNFAIGVDQGMDFIIKSTQLSIERYIEKPQLRGEAPTRAAVYLDLKNMFNSVSREQILHIIQSSYPELVPPMSRTLAFPTCGRTPTFLPEIGREDPLRREA